MSIYGVRQDFMVTDKPAGAGELVFCLAVTGFRVEATAYGAQLVLTRSGRKIACSRLRVTDATGKELPAMIEVAPQFALRTPRSALALAVVVNDAGAVYPVRIDPTFSDANWVILPGVDGTVDVAAVYGKGDLYIGGVFQTASNTAANYVAKWNGSEWSPFAALRRTERLGKIRDSHAIPRAADGDRPRSTGASHFGITPLSRLLQF